MADDTRTPAPKGVGAKPWIKMRTDLWDDPRVSALCDALDADEARVIGGLYRLWSIADAHSTDGTLSGLTIAAVDRKCAFPGFANALQSVGWLAESDAGVTIPDFSVHNGQSAKSRAQNSLRQQNRRSRGQSASKVSRSTRDRGETETRPASDARVTRREESRTDEKTSEEPPPSLRERSETLKSVTPHATSRIWQEVEGALVNAGLGNAAGTARAARDRGYSPEQVLELIDEFTRRRGEFSSEGALAWRIHNSPPTRPISEGWPGQANKPPTAERDREADLQRQRLKADLDRMALHNVVDLAERAGIENARVRLSERGKAILRPDELNDLLCELERTQSTSSADRNRRNSAGSVAVVPQKQAQPARRPRDSRTEAI